MAEQRFEVAAAQIVVKVPGAAGGETYLRRGRLLPATVEKAEVKRLLELGLIAGVDGADDADAGDESYKGVTVTDLKAEIDNRNKDREDAAKIAPAGTNRPDLVAALVADDAKRS
ncbi:hypothetical protein QE428_002601 [Microbacterium sp. SORGH_AS 505]|uniref:hypothetical protein n=1 Tax=Microbacterium sp. SORGH_AS_0505 TaxID=3041770 RepID=UPI002780E78D|nr:hypothetical protein [Microbacterium sp. SORGH_AS_0505]MDQ1127568.1 hypothetical protein [Microbacterium sp. SORGH_AS_0505]